jgi:uncharacterized protein YceK
MRVRILALAVLLVLAGCGGSQSTTPSESPATTVTTSQPTTTLPRTTDAVTTQSDGLALNYTVRDDRYLEIRNEGRDRTELLPGTTGP